MIPALDAAVALDAILDAAFEAATGRRASDLAQLDRTPAPVCRGAERSLFRRSRHSGRSRMIGILVLIAVLAVVIGIWRFA